MKARTVVFGVLGFSWYLVLLLAFLRELAGIPPYVEYYWRFPCILFIVAAWAIYLWNVFHNPRVPRDKRTLWAVILFLVGPWATPFYFWFYIRGEAAPSSATPAAP